MTEEDKRANPEEETGFKVSDRRKFSPDGELLEEGEVKKSSSTSGTVSPEEEKTRTEPKSDTSQDHSSKKGEEQIDFASFILSLATTALAHLGEVPDPETGEKTENLVAAKQMIDILSILEVKTKGNLDSDEARLLESLLYELRMKYLNRAKIIST